ncbi:MAG: protoporphyrinogen oxidase [Coriobacteriia bacterium]|nr:protoporphyrinogen oxidase [Coriobacteriia bacterium]
MKTENKHIVIVGGGVTGLAAAYQLERARAAGVAVSYTLLERDNRVGGKVAGEVVSDPETGEPYIVDGGPDCFSAMKPGGRRMTTMLDAEDDWLPSNDPRKIVWIFRDGQMHRLPEGFSMFVPTQLEPLFVTDLLSEEGKKDMIREMTLPARDWAAEGKTADGKGEARRDESLESFVTRRFGREVLDYLAEPFIGGVHASDPKDMSLAASFPMYFDLEEKYGSVIRGTVMSQAARKRAALTRIAELPEGAPKDIWGKTVFASYKLGMHELTDAIANKVAHNIRTGVMVDRITRTDDGSYRIETSKVDGASPYHSIGREGALSDSTDQLRACAKNADQAVFCGRIDEAKIDPEKLAEGVQTTQSYLDDLITADGVIIATESFAGADLTRDLDEDLSQAYASIPNLTSSTVSFAFREEDLGEGRSDGFGVLVPEACKRDLLAASWSSTKWPGRAPEGRVLIRGFAGTPLNQEVMDLPDDELIATVLQELKEVMGLPQEVEPLFARLYRWTLGMSQYKMGHLDHVETIEELTSATTGLACVGGCFRGVGIPNCIDAGEGAARKVMADFNLEYSGE